ncbi:MAG: LysR family transcriptional regulator [Cardiobacteriaceae bacterium]|nr:LysR family transcriptional regulator [Cardiobacteriaceae bacterium]
MKNADYAQLAAFVAIAESGSFRKAAARLNLKPSTLSHAMRALEDKLGVMLLVRTTRQVALSEAGQQLYARIAPAFAEVGAALEAVNDFREHPAGTVRLSAPRAVVSRFILPRLPLLAERYPDVVLEISADNGFVDIVKHGFDAGIRLGECVEKDMVAVRISPDLRDAVVATPEYLARHGTPRTPQDLLTHRCIGVRRIAGGDLYRWEFARHGEVLNVALESRLILDDADLVLDAALAGLGLAFCIEPYCAAQLASGQLQRVLQDWCPPYPGFFLYYPDRRKTAALRAVVEVLRCDS